MKENKTYDSSASQNRIRLESVPITKTPRLAGRTIDLTLFTVSKALDSLVGEIWSRRKLARVARGKWTLTEVAISRYADVVLFTSSTAIVMWAWFYTPDRLPRAYNHWIKKAANVDHRLVEVLRRARRAEFVYGKDTGQAPILEGMCREYGWPESWGDPSRTIPIPCEVVHMGTGPSCHWHMLVRFTRAFRFAFAMYLPLQLLIKLRLRSRKALWLALRDAARSSAFLGAFISLFYYGVCLSRTLVGPKLFGPKTVTPITWDSGVCVGAGCILSGWSILVEAARRRPELTLFIAPRAGATFVPRTYQWRNFWRERLAFSVSVAILITLTSHRPQRVRGMLGQALHSIQQ